CSTAARSATASRIAATVASASVQKNATQLVGSRTSTTRIRPPAGLYLARNVLYVLVTSSPYWTTASFCQPCRCAARLARLSLRLPYFGGRPRPRRVPGRGGSGRLHKAASLRRRLTTTTCAACAAFKNSRLAEAPSVTTHSTLPRYFSQSAAQATKVAACCSLVWNST